MQWKPRPTGGHDCSLLGHVHLVSINIKSEHFTLPKETVIRSHYVYVHAWSSMCCTGEILLVDFVWAKSGNICVPLLMFDFRIWPWSVLCALDTMVFIQYLANHCVLYLMHMCSINDAMYHAGRTHAPNSKVCLTTRVYGIFSWTTLLSWMH